MPLLKESEYFFNSVRSILIQDFQDFLLIIIDASPNSIFDKYTSLNNKKINYYCFPNISLPSALNFGYNLSKSKYIARMDADDISEINRIEMQFKYLEENKEVDIVGSNYYVISGNNKKLYERKMPEFHDDIEFSMPIKPTVLHPTIMLRRKVFERIGGYRNYITEDTDFFLRALSAGFKFYNIQEYLYNYRISPKKYSFYQLQNQCQLKLGEEYLEANRNKLSYNLKEYNSVIEFRLGLNEYYNGSMIKSRKHFKSSLKSNKKRFLKVFRYLIFCYLGDKIMRYLRKSQLLKKVNILIINITGFDTNLIKK